VVAIVFFGIAVLLAIPQVADALMSVFWFCAKAGFLLFAFIWIRATLPRFRYDQLMGFAWKFMFPAALLNLLLTGLMVSLF
jgi:NADH-quinone oxidoreductase subunit H